jgi:hypothetical protein
MLQGIGWMTPICRDNKCSFQTHQNNRALLPTYDYLGYDTSR